MLDHVSIGVRDVAAARRFYDTVLATLGYRPVMDGDAYVGYGRDYPEFWMLQTAAPVPADDRSGLHFCFRAANPEEVKAFHAAALAAGGTCNGAPGPRPDYGPTYYASFVKDPEGYRLEAHCEA